MAQSCASQARQAVQEFHAAVFQPNIELVVFFCSSEYDLDDLAAEMRSLFTGIQVVGCTTAGEIGPLGYRQHTVVRLGGDEFVLLLDNLDNDVNAEQLLNRLLQDIAQPILLHGVPTGVTVSIGVALYPRTQGTTEQLLKHADEAMLAAKRAGKSRYHFFQ